MTPISPFTARVVGAAAGALLSFLGAVGLDATTDTSIATAETFAFAVVTFLGFVGYGVVHKLLDRGKDQ